MRDLRTIRICLTIFFVVASIAYLFIGRGLNPVVSLAPKAQIVPSMLVMTMGATGFWLVATFFLGRIYCSSVCPVGGLQDSATWLRRKMVSIRFFSRLRKPFGRGKLFAPYSFRKSSRLRWLWFSAYVVCLLLGLYWLATIIEPWSMMRSAARISNPYISGRLLIFAENAAIGACYGCVILAGVWLWALFCGRRFCTDVCPIGTALGAVSRFAIYHIEIDPDRCTNCMRCEEVCKTQGIKVVGRYVDNERCVRCFDCLKVCADNAINFQRNRNQRVNPLMRKSTESEGV